jgi:hypothetical protein
MQRTHIQAKKWAANGNKDDATACQTYWTLECEYVASHCI